MKLDSITMSVTVVSVGWLAALSGCSAGAGRMGPAVAPDGNHAVAADTPAAGKPENSQAAKPSDKPESDDAAKAKRADERAHKRAKLERDLAIARLKVGQAQTAAQHAELQNQAVMSKATAELGLVSRKLQNFSEHTAPTRMARAELNLQRAGDGAKEAEEELAQLQLMYKDEQFAEQTKEIVIERGKRRLERARRDLEIQQTELATLKEKTLPTETHELELPVQEKQREIERLRREAESTRTDKQIAIMSAEAEIARIETELADVEKEEKEAREKAAKEKP